MRTSANSTDLTLRALDGRCDAMLLGRLGSELALIYHDTLQAPVPPGLQALIDRLDFALNAKVAGAGAAVSHGDRARKG